MKERLAAVLRAVRPDRANLKEDALAGLPGAIGSVPDGMAAGILAGVNPVHGLYASFAGPIAGGLTASTSRMVITTTSAAALAAGSAIESVPADDRPGALFLLTALAGVAMVVAGLVRLGRYVRFVPHSVMIGFLTGVAINIVCGQLADLTGVSASGANSVAKALDVLLHPRHIEVASLAIGLLAIALMAGLAKTRLNQVSALVALVIPSIAVGVLSLDVTKAADGGAIPSGLPMPAVPNLTYLSVSLVTGALAVAVLVLVQGAGVSESAPNPTGRKSDTNQDFVAQGVGNVASSLFLGQPVGGSVGQTALNISAGARTRWASILSGVWMVVILVALSGLVGKVAIPTLAAVLIYAALGSVRPAEIMAILRTGNASRIALGVTFVATLLLPVAQAVAIGVATSLLLQLNREALDLRVVELVPLDGGAMREQPAPQTLPSETVTVLDVYGSLLYAGSRTLQSRLPDPAGAVAPVVVLRLRGRTSLGATFFLVAADYAQRLAECGGRLYISGADPALIEQMERNGKLDTTGPVRVFEAHDVVGESTARAVQDARTWLVEHRADA